MVITSRDINLLTQLAKNTVMSFEEVRRFVFSGKHKSTVCNRLKKLEAMSLIRRINVGNLIYKRDMRSIGVVLQITKTGITALKNVGRFDNKWRAEPTVINIQSLVHDLELNELMRTIEQLLPNVCITNGKHLNADVRSEDKKVPDAVIEMDFEAVEKAKEVGLLPQEFVLKPGASLRLALELELTVKSAERYRDIITSYRVGENYDRVLYIAIDEAVFLKIQSVLAGFQVKGNLRSHIGIFSFMSLNMLNSKKSLAVCKNDQTHNVKDGVYV